MSSRRQFQAIPIRSKPERSIKIRKRETNFNTEADIPVKQTQISTLRAKTTSRAKTSYETSRSNVSVVSNVTSRSSPKQTQQSEISTLNNQDLIGLREDLLKSHNFSEVNPHDLNMLLSHLRVYSTDCVLSRDYDKAEACDNLANEIRTYLKHPDTSRSHNSEDNDRLHNQLMQFADKLDEFDQQTIQRRSELEKRHESDLCQFDHYWQTEAPRKYRKPSQKLLSLSENERRVGLQGDYKLARELKAKADKLRKIEADIAQQRLNADYVSARDKLLDKQMQERASFDKIRAEAREALAAKQEVNIRAAANREKVLAFKERHTAITSSRADKHSVEPSKSSIASMLGREKDYLLLPKLVPPDYNAIRQSENEKNKEASKKGKETEERLKQKDEERIRFFEEYESRMKNKASFIQQNENKKEKKEDNTQNQNNEENTQNENKEEKKESSSSSSSSSDDERKNQNQNPPENQQISHENPQNTNENQPKSEEQNQNSQENKTEEDGLVKPDPLPSGLVTQIKSAVEIDDSRKPTIVLGDKTENQEEKKNHDKDNEYYSDYYNGEEDYYYSDDDHGK
ncbi:hypothetical protein TVAG_233310 [Trichomonas vaginalis G3]|uniref:Uncharacterized protein n=1 Tax=Trichomonas vaginalis (strain ATCC PRA-98 / G3) TaxID=412133 RepID=A2ES00_TRIV3|nr:hypothetical protein TVAGG3_0486870 [Trichomonas vaginalis G3]EAY04595.1 hypothetical protein TVAG_233310 [Trichomonas vaginalis G3]KAI5516095.1 hypothetical protein TVAGG3_0486870 [Trichomonas vaginalis G3]|eukprot:XP_001316818.1 hypothetical protein [Trichomonas vaginalis G3]